MNIRSNSYVPPSVVVLRKECSPHNSQTHSDTLQFREKGIMDGVGNLQSFQREPEESQSLHVPHTDLPMEKPDLPSSDPGRERKALAKCCASQSRQSSQSRARRPGCSSIHPESHSILSRPCSQAAEKIKAL